MNKAGADMFREGSLISGSGLREGAIHESHEFTKKVSAKGAARLIPTVTRTGLRMVGLQTGSHLAQVPQTSSLR